MKKLLGLLGKAGSGKDTVAEKITPSHWIEPFGSLMDVREKLLDPPLVEDSAQAALADGMKEFCLRVYHFSLEQLWGPSPYRNAPDLRYPRADGTFLTPREALQKLGTEWGRACWEDTWVNFTIDRVRQWEEKLVVISDVRFANEVRAIKAAGGVIWYIDRPGAGLAGEAGKHASEQEQESLAKEADLIIYNGGTIRDLVREIMLGLRKGGMA